MRNSLVTKMFKLSSDLLQRKKYHYMLLLTVLTVYDDSQDYNAGEENVFSDVKFYRMK